MMPYNPYAMNPYIMQQQQPDIGGLSPVFQNIGQQQATQNAALAQQNQLVSDASKTGQSSGMNPMMMAAMLRGGQGTNPYLNAAKAMIQYGPENVYGYGGQGQVPTTTTGMD
jgi:hypothetical protein